MALRIADVGYVLETGRITLTGSGPGAAHQRGGQEGLSGHLSPVKPNSPGAAGEFLRQNSGAALLTKRPLFVIHVTNIMPKKGRDEPMRQCMDADNLHRRLRKIIGQVQAIDRMVDEDVPCEDILAQINAAKSALHKAGQVVLEGHLQHCVRDGIEHGDAEKTIQNFAKAVERFSNMG